MTFKIPGKKSMIATLSATAIIALLSSTAVHATLYDYAPRKGSGSFQTFSSRYDSVTNKISFNMTAKQKSSNKTLNTFTMVVSNGPNPKSHVNEYAILYGDLNTKRITAYVYDGNNNRKSYKNQGDYIGTFENAITIEKYSNGTSQIKVSNFDVSSINNYVPQNGKPNQWLGTAFGSKAGVWAAVQYGSNLSYANNKKINNFSEGLVNWHDTSNIHTTKVTVSSSSSSASSTGGGTSTSTGGSTSTSTSSTSSTSSGADVSEPATLLLLAAAAGGAFAIRRKFSAKK